LADAARVFGSLQAFDGGGDATLIGGPDGRTDIGPATSVRPARRGGAWPALRIAADDLSHERRL